MSDLKLENVNNPETQASGSISSKPKELEAPYELSTVPELLLSNVTISDLKAIQLTQCNWYELVCTICAGFIFIGLYYVPGKAKNALYIGSIGVSFGSYVVYKIKRFGCKLIKNDWGLTLNNFKISFLWCSVAGIVGVFVMLIYMAIYKTGLPFHYDLVLMLILYPLWGIIQQFLIQAMIAVNLSKLQLHYVIVILLTACSFTLVHWPEWLLMLATFAVGLTFTPIYLKYKCLYPLGLYHGWCGALFYWLVLEENPMQRF
eukprot:253290_1